MFEQVHCEILGTLNASRANWSYTAWPTIPCLCTAEVCDLVKGSWVPDPRPPQYTNSTCNFIQGHQNCMKNGRPDTGFLYWKWKPDQCDLPRIDAQAFLTAMRNRSMAFAGDSIARNQFQSLLCLLSQVFSILRHIQVGGYKFASSNILDLYRLNFWGASMVNGHSQSVQYALSKHRDLSTKNCAIKTCWITNIRRFFLSFFFSSLGLFLLIFCTFQVEMPDHTYQAPDDRDNVHVFRTYNFTVAIYWSPYLVKVENKEITWNNRTQAVAHIHVDKLDEAWVDRISGVDILQLSTGLYGKTTILFFLQDSGVGLLKGFLLTCLLTSGHSIVIRLQQYWQHRHFTAWISGQWWFKRGLFLQDSQALGGHICDGWEGCDKEIGFALPYRLAIHTLLQDSISIPGYSGTTILRTFAPDHFEGGSWDNGGKCVRTAPGGVPISSLTNWMYEIQIEEYQNVTGM